MTYSKSNPYSRAYFKDRSKKYVALARKSFKRIEKEYEKMYTDGEPNDSYEDQTMCDYYDLENLLEFVDCKDDFYEYGSCFVDLIRLDNRIEYIKEKLSKAMKSRESMMTDSFKLVNKKYTHLS